MLVASGAAAPRREVQRTEQGEKREREDHPAQAPYRHFDSKKALLDGMLVERIVTSLPRVPAGTWVSAEDLRQGLRRCRSFFERLLAA